MLEFRQFFPIVAQLGHYLKVGMDHYADLRSAGKEAGPDMMAAFLQVKMEEWEPKVGAAALLDDDTRAAAARFLAGVIVNFARS